MECDFGLLPGIILSIPFGVVADRYGRRIVLFLSMSGMVLSIIWYETICKAPKYPIRRNGFAKSYAQVGGQVCFPFG